MIIEFRYDEKDFLTYQLYTASKSESTQKKRKRSRILVPIVYLILGIMFLVTDDLFIGISFLLIGVLWYFLYPAWERKKYLKHYEKFTDENFKNRNAEKVTIEFSDDYIFSKDSGMESKILTSEIVEINEIPTLIMIKLKNGQSFLLPKQKIAEINKVKTRIKELADHLKVQYHTDDNWKWK